MISKNQYLIKLFKFTIIKVFKKNCIISSIVQSKNNILLVFKFVRMVDIIRALDFIWIPQKYWEFRDNEELYFGNDYNNSGLLRFTNFIYVRILTLIKKV